ncbi:hypothetical protein BGZ83_003366 [Gryganskiella cystojenkinii]|nr:hypothetical protein BGZ83_003366 [Gryganskiella cystojenkinii]
MPNRNNYKNINKWLAELKNIDSSLKTLDKEITTNAKLISGWGTNEGDDLTDVCQRMTQLMEEIGLIHQSYSLRHIAYRKMIKNLKTQEMTLDDNRKRKHDLTNQIAKHQKSSKENPIKMMELQSQLERVSHELLQQELELLQFKRVTIRDAFNQQFDAMLEYSEKMALIAGYGRQITNVIDTGPQLAESTALYGGAEYTAAALNQVKLAVTSWHPQPIGAAVRAHVGPSHEELALSPAVTNYTTRTPIMRQQFADDSPDNRQHSNGYLKASPENNHNNSSTLDDLQMLKVDASQTSLHESSAMEYDWKQEAPTPGGMKSNRSSASPPPPKHVEASPYIHSLQVNQLEQQRQLQLEQQRAYQQSINSYSNPSSPVSGRSSSPSPNNYQSAASVANTLRQTSIDSINGGSGGSNGGGGGGLVIGRPFTPTMLRRNDSQELYNNGSQGRTSPSPSYSNYQQQHQQPASYESNVSSAPSRGYRLGFTDPRERNRMENVDLYKTEVNPGPAPGSIAARFSRTSSESQGPVLVKASQDAAHYFLPSNIYDNLPPGVTPPPAGRIAPPPAETDTDTAAVLSTTPSENKVDPRTGRIIIPPLSPGPDATPTIDIPTPTLNTVFTPGSSLVLTWTNNGIVFPENWKPPQSLMDLIKSAPNFSNSPLLTEEDMTNLAKIKLEELKRAQLANTFKDSPLWLNSLRIVSWPLGSSSSTNPSSSTVSISPSILTDPGYSLLNVSRIAISGGSSGQLIWTIPEDWNFEGEFEIRVPSLFMDNAHQRPAKSHSFWILRDAATRALHPEYNTPLVLGPSSTTSKTGTIGGSGNGGSLETEALHRQQKEMGIFLGVGAMLLAFVLLGLGVMMGRYRRKWAARQRKRQEQQQGQLTGGDLSAAAMVREREPVSGPLAMMNGDDDAQPTEDLNLSSVTLGFVEQQSSAFGSKADPAKEHESLDSPSYSTTLPLYEARESTTDNDCKAFV